MDCIYNTSFSALLTNGPTKLKRYISISRKGSQWTSTLAYRAHLKVTKKMKSCEYQVWPLLPNVLSINFERINHSFIVSAKAIPRNTN